MSKHSANEAQVVNAAQTNRDETWAIALTPTHAALVDQIVHREAERLGETPEQVRRVVEIGIVTRGIAAMRGEQNG